MKPYKFCCPSPIGTIELQGTEFGITSLVFTDLDPDTLPIPEPLKECCIQLDEYFAGVRTEFTVKLAPQGTDFQKKVWEALIKIPCGQTISYMEMAAALGRDKAIRAVGHANAKNPISIIIPCHRMLGANGALRGYAGGLWRKEWLLSHEKNIQEQL